MAQLSSVHGRRDNKRYIAPVQTSSAHPLLYFHEFHEFSPIYFFLILSSFVMLDVHRSILAS